MNTSRDTELAYYYDEYHQPLLRYLLGLVHVYETAEDLCQETFIKAFRAWDQRDITSDARGWFYRIARNTAYDYFRQQRRALTTQLADDDPSLAQLPENEAQIADAQSILAAMHQLAPHYRIPLMLYSYAGYDIRSIAALLECTDATIKTRLHRARNQFRQHYVAG